MTKRNWTMSKKEITRLEIINKYLEKRLTQVAAAKVLGISERHFRRLLNNYRRYQMDGLISKRRGNSPNNKVDDKTRRSALELIQKHYCDFGPTFAHEKLFEHHRHLFAREFSIESLRNWMIEAELHRFKKRKALTVHQSRPRRCRLGEMIQIDGSYHDWFEGRAEPCTLIAFIDDATSQITAGFFCRAETTFNYMRCLKQHLGRYGCPLSIYSDRHSIFSNNAKEKHSLHDPSQFSRALQNLDIQLYTANSPQAKGRIERLFKTLQDRLPKEMRLQNINTLEQANLFFEQYRCEYNRRFAKEPQDSFDSHRAIPCDKRQLQLILSKQSIRKLSKNLICQYHNIQYLIKIKTPGYAMRGACITICELLNGEIVLLYKGRELVYSIYQEKPPLPPHQDAKTINSAVDKLLINQAKGHKPATTHPWRCWNPDYLNSTLGK